MKTCRNLTAVLVTAGMLLSLVGCTTNTGGTIHRDSGHGFGLKTFRLKPAKPGLPHAIADVPPTAIAQLQGERIAPANPSAPKPKSSFLYRIRKGETLAILARRYYGDPKLWKRIYEANRNVLANPNVLTPGMLIKLPR